MAVRLLKKLGWLRTLILLALSTGFIGQLVIVDATWSIVVLGCGVIGMVHFRRKDIPFLRSVIHRYQYMLALEYLLIVAPLLLIVLFNKAFAGVFLLLFFASILPFATPHKSNWEKSTHRITHLTLLVPSYEWIAGVRKLMILIILLLAVGMAGSYFSYIWVLSAAFGMTAVGASFYSLNEPRRFIRLTADNPSKFLLKKTGLGAGLYAISTLPLWIVTFVFYPDFYLYTALFGLANIILLVSVIIAKYVFYGEQKNMELPLSTIFIVFSLLLLTPYMQLVVPLVMAYLWIRAVRRLNIDIYAYA